MSLHIYPEEAAARAASLEAGLDARSWLWGSHMVGQGLRISALSLPLCPLWEGSTFPR